MLTAMEQRRVADLREAQKQAKGRLRRLKVLADGRETEFCRALKEEIEFSAKATDSEIEATLVGEPSTEPLKEWAKIRQLKHKGFAYRGIINVIDKAEERLEMTNEKIGEYSEQIREIEERSEDRKGKSISKARKTTEV